MYDSFGDGWNGNTFTIGTETATLLTGSQDTSYFCITDGCYSVTCTGGSWLKFLGNYMIIARNFIEISGGVPYGPTDVQIGTTMKAVLFMDVLMNV